MPPPFHTHTGLELKIRERLHTVVRVMESVVDLSHPR